MNLLFVVFNARCNKWFSGDINTHTGLEFDNLFSLADFTQSITEATNLEPNKRKTCIDLIFLSQPNLISDSGVLPSFFDTCHHQITFAKIGLNFYHPPPYEREVWSYDHGNIGQINRAISLFDWDSALSPLDVSKQVKIFF